MLILSVISGKRGTQGSQRGDLVGVEGYDHGVVGSGSCSGDSGGARNVPRGVLVPEILTVAIDSAITSDYTCIFRLLGEETN